MKDGRVHAGATRRMPLERGVNILVVFQEISTFDPDRMRVPGGAMD